MTTVLQENSTGCATRVYLYWHMTGCIYRVSSPRKRISQRTRLIIRNMEGGLKTEAEGLNLGALGLTATGNTTVLIIKT